MIIIFRLLIKILKDSSDATVLAVAAHDIGQYVKHYDRGKKFVAILLFTMKRLRFLSFRIVADLGGKARVMELMSHPDSDLRYHALLSVQQLVSQPWLAV
jgi:V-type H+-transporting ATPase subunit H